MKIAYVMFKRCLSDFHSTTFVQIIICYSFGKIFITHCEAFTGCVGIHDHLLNTSVLREKRKLLNWNLENIKISFRQNLLEETE